jgi:hypothetical protein
MLLAALIVTTLATPPTAIALLVGWGRQQRARPDGRTTVVLGAKIDETGKPSPALTRRLHAAAALPPLQAVLFCGGNGEAEAMAAWWQTNTSETSVPTLERTSRTTDENAREARRMLGDVAVLVVTDDLHALRAASAFRAEFSDVAVHHARTPGFPWRNGLRELGGWMKRGLRRCQTSRDDRRRRSSHSGNNTAE